VKTASRAGGAPARGFGFENDLRPSATEEAAREGDFAWMAGKPDAERRPPLREKPLTAPDDDHGKKRPPSSGSFPSSDRTPPGDAPPSATPPPPDRHSAAAFGSAERIPESSERGASANPNPTPGFPNPPPFPPAAARVPFAGYYEKLVADFYAGLYGAGGGFPPPLPPTMMMPPAFLPPQFYPVPVAVPYRPPESPEESVADEEEPTGEEGKRGGSAGRDESDPAAATTTTPRRRAREAAVAEDAAAEGRDEAAPSPRGSRPPRSSPRGGDRRVPPRSSPRDGSAAASASASASASPSPSPSASAADADAEYARYNEGYSGGSFALGTSAPVSALERAARVLDAHAAALERAEKALADRKAAAAAAAAAASVSVDEKGDGAPSLGASFTETALFPAAEGSDSAAKVSTQTTQTTLASAAASIAPGLGFGSYDVENDLCRAVWRVASEDASSLLPAFHSHDRGQKGYLRLSELRALLSTLDPLASARQLDRVEAMVLADHPSPLPGGSLGGDGDDATFPGTTLDGLVRAAHGGAAAAARLATRDGCLTAATLVARLENAAADDPATFRAALLDPSAAAAEDPSSSDPSSDPSSSASARALPRRRIETHRASLTRLPRLLLPASALQDAASTRLLVAALDSPAGAHAGTGPGDPLPAEAEALLERFASLRSELAEVARMLGARETAANARARKEAREAAEKERREAERIRARRRREAAGVLGEAGGGGDGSEGAAAKGSASDADKIEAEQDGQAEADKMEAAASASREERDARARAAVLETQTRTRALVAAKVRETREADARAKAQMERYYEWTRGRRAALVRAWAENEVNRRAEANRREEERAARDASDRRRVAERDALRASSEALRAQVARDVEALEREIQRVGELATSEAEKLRLGWGDETPSDPTTRTDAERKAAVAASLDAALAEAERRASDAESAVRALAPYAVRVAFDGFDGREYPSRNVEAMHSSGEALELESAATVSLAEEEAAAATKIQATFKGNKARRDLEAARLEETRAATKIQATFKGNKVRAEMQREARASEAES